MSYDTFQYQELAEPLLPLAAPSIPSVDAWAAQSPDIFWPPWKTAQLQDALAYVEFHAPVRLDQFWVPSPELSWRTWFLEPQEGHLFEGLFPAPIEAILADKLFEQSPEAHWPTWRFEAQLAGLSDPLFPVPLPPTTTLDRWQTDPAICLWPGRFWQVPPGEHDWSVVDALCLDGGPGLALARACEEDSVETSAAGGLGLFGSAILGDAVFASDGSWTGSSSQALGAGKAVSCDTPGALGAALACSQAGKSGKEI